MSSRFVWLIVDQFIVLLSVLRFQGIQKSSIFCNCIKNPWVCLTCIPASRFQPIFFWNICFIDYQFCYFRICIYQDRNCILNGLPKIGCSCSKKYFPQFSLVFAVNLIEIIHALILFTTKTKVSNWFRLVHFFHILQITQVCKINFFYFLKIVYIDEVLLSKFGRIVYCLL